MSEPLVSIVLPTYNRAHLLGHAIRSVLAQTHRHLELLIVDDKSKDHTSDVVAGFDDPRIRYVRNDSNLKLPGALNRGFGMARGDYLTWTSDDNLYAPTAIERMVATLSTGECDFVYADYFDFAKHEERTGEPIAPRRIMLPEVLRLDERNSVGACFMYTRRVCETVGGYDPELFLVEDYDYFIRIQKAGFRIRHLPEALYYFSRHDDSLFCARYAEVRSADVLVRYKNGLLDGARAREACVELLMRDLEGLRSPLLKAAYRRIAGVSYRLTIGYKRALRAYLSWKIGARVAEVLDKFTSRTLDFRQAKDALRGVLQGIGTLEYKP